VPTVSHTPPTVENYKLLVRNLRTGKHHEVMAALLLRQAKARDDGDRQTRALRSK